MNTYEKSAVEEVATDGTVTDKKEATDETHRAMALGTTEEQRIMKDAIKKVELEEKSLQMLYCEKNTTPQNSDGAVLSKTDGEESLTDATEASSISNASEGDEQQTKEASESEDDEQRQIEGERAAAIEVNNEILRVIQEQLQNISTQMLDFNREMSELANERKAKDEGPDRLEQQLDAIEAQMERIKVTDPKPARLN